MHTGLTPKPAATSYGEGFVFRVYKPVVQLRVVVGCGLKEEDEEEVVVTHHAITGTIPSHRIIFMCVPRGCPKVFRRRSYLGCVGTTRLPQPPSVCFWIFFRQIRWLPSLSLQDSTAKICLVSQMSSGIGVPPLMKTTQSIRSGQCPNSEFSRSKPCTYSCCADEIFCLYSAQLSISIPIQSNRNLSRFRPGNSS